ncbi:DNA replication/repair protein RecF [Candidatus Daviesbacteria bacterium]|nr:DNA replication/repair protein RecF [Candidatus Daviesbacteria bacterium]
MFLKQLKLTNFRNYSALNLELDKRPTILVGNNAAGKSNLLEAVYFLSTTKSGRVDEESELIKKGQSVARVEGEILEMKLEVAMQVQDNGQFSKRIKVNGIPKKVIDYIGKLPVVLFSPADINMMTGAPSLRRWHLDLSLAQVDFQYKKALTLYEQVLSSRNKVLKRIKEGQGRVDELSFWTDELVKHGEVVAGGRKAFLESMNNFKSPLGEFLFEYKQSKLSHERLQEYNGREIAASVTLIGPHRDDFVVKLAGRNLAIYGSRGEQRTATLAFKLAQLEYMALSLGKRPILLLDDVFSELDANHRAAVVAVVGRQQAIIATVELENIPKTFLNQARILRVEDGKVTF